jgi:ABC-type transport system involved in cytochrome bd biosynthesis fused ATPase/permease subunit
MTDGAVEPTGDVLPPLVSDILALSWLLLFTIRWVVVQLLLLGGVISAQAVYDLDRLVLVRCYLVLLTITIVVCALRVTRGLTSDRAKRQSQGSETQADRTSVQPMTSDPVGRRPGSRD